MWIPSQGGERFRGTWLGGVPIEGVMPGGGARIDATGIGESAGSELLILLSHYPALETERVVREGDALFRWRRCWPGRIGRPTSWAGCANRCCIRPSASTGFVPEGTGLELVLRVPRSMFDPTEPKSPVVVTDHGDILVSTNAVSMADVPRHAQSLADWTGTWRFADSEWKPEATILTGVAEGGRVRGAMQPAGMRRWSRCLRCMGESSRTGGRPAAS